MDPVRLTDPMECRDDGEGGVTLTPRELEVVQLLAEGKSNKEAGAALNVSIRTIESHRNHIMHKMGSASFSQLIRFAIRKQPCGALTCVLKGKRKARTRGVKANYFFAVFRRLRRREGRSAGASPITSAVQIEVTNFFTPWLSKSMVVRSVFDSVTTPIPYCSWRTVCPSSKTCKMSSLRSRQSQPIRVRTYLFRNGDRRRTLFRLRFLTCLPQSQRWDGVRGL